MKRAVGPATVLAGGTQGWIHAGLPVDRGPDPRGAEERDGKRGDLRGFDRAMGAIDVGGIRRWRREAALIKRTQERERLEARPFDPRTQIGRRRRATAPAASDHAATRTRRN